MIFGSVCSGIEAASVAWRPLGWQAAFFAEIERFPSAVLAHHYPEVENRGDLTRYRDWPDRPGSIDLLVGGTPCQSFSVAGLRAGMDDPRSNLALVYLGLVARLRPRWVVWENVPGVLSSSGGRDFGAFLGALGELGYGWAYRILDAQYFGVPQRRRRVFVVGYLGDWRRAAAVLFESESLRRHPAPRRKKREGTSPTLTVRPRGGGGLGTDHDLDGGLVAVSGTLGGGSGSRGWVNDIGSGAFIPEISRTLRGQANASHCADSDTYVPEIVPQAMSAKWAKGTSGPAGIVPIAFSANATELTPGTIAPTLRAMPHDKSHANSGHQIAAVVDTFAVRRLTPREAERLQGFPDDYTLVPHRNKPAADGPRYKALGNSMAVPVMRWIGERIALVEAAQPGREGEG